MAYLDDEEEEEMVPQSVSNYHFEDDDKEPISFSVLPIKWNDKESTEGNNMDVFLRGTADDGLNMLYKPVKAWRFYLSNVKPELSVLTKDNLWIKLEKPRKSFEQLIRSVLITVHSLHYLRRNPQVSGKTLWEHLSRVFGLYDVKPSQNDLIDHMGLISEAVKRDDCLANSKFLLAFLEEKPLKKRLPDEENPRASLCGFIVDDMIEDVEEDDSDDEDYFESVCAICDNGGELLCCDGSCLRSFHATEEDGADSVCESLGLAKREVDAIQQFLCKNCQYKRHQCFVCRQLGSSDKSAGAEVFQCVSATCGYFYHPRCVAKLLHKGNKAESEALEKKIASGESFTCPLHKCCVCKQGEVKTDPNLQFAVCRRCPKSYHWKCLPREIAFKHIDDEDEKVGVTIRAWAGLLKNRVLLYCLDHEVDDELGTPARDHVKFPFIGVKKKTIVEGKKQVLEPSVLKEEARRKSKNLALGDSHEGKTAVKSTRESSLTLKEGAVTKNVEIFFSRSDSLTKEKEIDTSRRSLMNKKKSRMMALGKARTANKNEVSLGEKLFNYTQDPEQAKLRKGDSAVTEFDNKAVVTVASKELSGEPFTLDADSERRLLALMKEAVSSITMEEIVKKHEVPSTHTSSIKHAVEKAITLGKVEGSVQAVRAALEKLVDGNNIEDAMAVCEPEVLNQIFKWKDKLKVYLAPFLYGPRYTSFGRHFTKVDKLQEIVDRLHCYAQDGDMIVDFCCGANDFSCLMKKKLEGTGKKCSFKNYDVLQAKNDFNFEKRDWMTVQKKELPPGAKLIMGLNPPFGVKAALANKFINKALEFEPKLLILIVPVETERLDGKEPAYELVWEDDQFLSGKSFYLPGSVDGKDKQVEDWNVVSPPLSLWSRLDWAVRHKEIAQKHGHLSMHSKDSHVGKNDHEADVSAHQTRDQTAGLGDASMPLNGPPDGCYGDNSMLVDHDVPMELDGPKVALEDDIGELRLDNSESRESQVGLKSLSNNSLRKRKIDEENHARETCEKSFDSSNVSKKSNTEEDNIRGLRERSLDSNDMFRRRKNRREENVRGMHEWSGDGQRAIRPFRDDIYNNLDPLLSPSSAMIGQRSHEPFGASYGGNLDSFHDEIGGRYGTNLAQQFKTDRMSDYGVYGGEFGRDADLRAQIRLYGKEPGVPGPSGQGQNVHFDPVASTASYGHLVSAPESLSYRMHRSAMQQRYAPGIDELNYRRLESFGSELPPPSVSGLLPPPPFASELLPPPPAFGSEPPPPPPPPPRSPFFGNSNGVYDPMGFAPGPHHPNTYRHSTGWLNDE